MNKIRNKLFLLICLFIGALLWLFLTEEERGPSVTLHALTSTQEMNTPEPLITKQSGEAKARSHKQTSDIKFPLLNPENSQPLTQSLEHALVRCDWSDLNATEVLSKVLGETIFEKALDFNLHYDGFRIRTEKQGKNSMIGWNARHFRVDPDGFPTLIEEKFFKTFEGFTSWSDDLKKGATSQIVQGVWSVSLEPELSVEIKIENTMIDELRLQRGNQVLGCKDSQCQCVGS